MKEIRIAVCLFGQLRTGLYCAEYIKEWYNLDSVTIGDSTYPVKIDFYCSVKDYNTNGHVAGKLFGQASIEMISQSELNQLFSIYNPVKSKIINHALDLIYYDKWVYLPMITGLIDSILLKSRHELENNFVYDYCFCQRYDCLVHPIDSIKKVISRIDPGSVVAQYVHINASEDGHVCMGDFWWAGDSLSIDLMAASLGRIQFINEKRHPPEFWYSGLGPNVCLYKCLLENDVMVRTPNFGFDIVPVRPESDLTIPVLDSFLIHREFYAKNHPGLPKT